MQGDKAEDVVAGSQPPNGEAPSSRKSLHCGDSKDEQVRMKSTMVKMAVKLLAFGRAGSSGPRPTQVAVMIQVEVYLSKFVCMLEGEVPKNDRLDALRLLLHDGESQQ